MAKQGKGTGKGRGPGEKCITPGCFSFAVKGGTHCNKHLRRADNDTNPFRKEFVPTFGNHLSGKPFFTDKFGAQKEDFDIKNRW